MADRSTTRRGLLVRSAAAIAAFGLTGCDRLIRSETARKAFADVDRFDRSVQEAMLSPDALAPEYAKADLSPHFYANGSTDPDDAHYKEMAADGFKTYSLIVDG